MLWNIKECDKTTVWHERQFIIHILFFFLWNQWPAISICVDADWKGGQSVRAGGLKINATIQYSTLEWAHVDIPQQLGITRIFSDSSRIKLPLIVLYRLGLICSSCSSPAASYYYMWVTFHTSTVPKKRTCSHTMTSTSSSDLELNKRTAAADRHKYTYKWRSSGGSSLQPSVPLDPPQCDEDDGLSAGAVHLVVH